MGRLIAASVETSYLAQLLVKTVDHQQKYAAAFAPMLDAFEGLERTKKVIESYLVLQELTFTSKAWKSIHKHWAGPLIATSITRLISQLYSSIALRVLCLFPG